MVQRIEIIFSTLLVLILLSCSPGKEVATPVLPLERCKNPGLKTLARYSQKVKKVKARGWIKVFINGKEEPSFRFDLYWEKGALRGATFNITGYGPFSMPLFEALYKDGELYLCIFRDHVIYRREVLRGKFRVIERAVSNLFLDPWGLSLVHGARFIPLANGIFRVSSVIEGRPIYGTYSSTLQPLCLKIPFGEVSYGLPRRMRFNIKVNDIRIKVLLNFNEFSYVTNKSNDKSLSLQDLLRNGFRPLPFSLLLERLKE